MRRRNLWATLPAAMAGFLLLIACLYAAVASFAFSESSYVQSPPPFDEMARELVGYLSGTQESLSPTLFTDRERLHMVDVLALFAGGRSLAIGCLAAGVALAVLAGIRGGHRRLGRGLLMGMGVFGAMALCIVLWALIDFSGWFQTMHEWVFTNDLWLLDPAESMLIRMMPLDFFIRAVQAIGLRFAGSALVLGGIAAACALIKKEKAIS